MLQYHLPFQPGKYPAVLSAPPETILCFKNYLIEAGLSIRFMELTDQGDEFFGDLLENDSEETIYFFTYCSNKHIAERLAHYSSARENNPKSTFRFIYNPKTPQENTGGYFLVFALQEDWVKVNYNELAPHFEEYVNQVPLLFNMADNVNLMNIDALYHLKKIEKKIYTNHKDLFCLRVNVLALIMQFFNYADLQGMDNDDNKQDPYVNAMNDLKIRLSYFLKMSLPDLDVFAKEYNMSLSSLKRHFKNVHGKPIYEFYLEQKMILAKNILENSRKSVSQVAYEIGYEDPNSLIKSFKKVFGTSPGKVA
jgi:AraC-like DNA-binding protein